MGCMSVHVWQTTTRYGVNSIVPLPAKVNEEDDHDDDVDEENHPFKFVT